MNTPSALAATANAAGAWQLLRLHRPELALRMAEQLLAANPAALPALLARAEALRQLGRLPEAAEAAREALGTAPQSDAAFFALARILGQQGELRQAHAHVVEALSLDPLNADYHAFQAQLLYLLGRQKPAIASADAGLRLNGNHPDCLLWRAMAQEQLDQPDQADADFRRVLRLAPNSALAHTQRGKQLLWRCEPAMAAVHLAEALRLSPTQSPALIPLLRQARREQHWPAWLRRHQRQLRQERKLGIIRDLPSRVVSLALPWHRLRSWWLTRHDPLFRLSRTQLWQYVLKLLLGSVLLLPVLITVGGHFDLVDVDAPLSMSQMLGLLTGATLYLIAVHLVTQKAKS